MPGLMAMRAEYGATKPLTGARITGSLHMTVQTAVLIETLVDARRRGALGELQHLLDPGPRRGRGRRRAAGTAHDPRGVPVFAWKGETLEEYWWCTEQALTWPGHDGPTMILDDGGDATLLVHKGVEFEKAGVVPDVETADSEEFAIVLSLLARSLGSHPGKWTTMAAGIRGVSEETTTGVHRLYEMARDNTLLFPAINVNDAVTKSKFDNKYGCRHSLIDGINRATDVLIGGKVAVVCGYGDVGKGCAESLRGQGARVIVTEIDPICALQAAMDGYQVATLEDVLAVADLLITATGNKGVVSVDQMARMKHQASSGTSGTSTTRSTWRASRPTPGVRGNVKPQVDLWRFPDGHAIIVLSEGRLLNLGNATGHPSFVMSNSFTNQVMAQLELYRAGADYATAVHTLPKHLDEKVARLHLDALGVRLTTLREDQAAYLGVPVDGPFKPDTYRY